MADEFMTPEFAYGAPISTPLRREAGRLRAVLPAGWRVDVVATDDPARSDEPVVRALPVTG